MKKIYTFTIETLEGDTKTFIFESLKEAKKEYDLYFDYGYSENFHVLTISPIKVRMV